MTLQFSIQGFVRTACAALCASVLAAPALAQSSARRFQAMDDNGDGVISMREWRGSTESFRRHDWNNDGVLSGDEIRPSARRRDTRVDDDEDDAGWQSEPNDWTASHFQDLDDDGDGRITRGEWRHSDDSFRRIDRNDDGSMSEREFLGEEDIVAESRAFLAGQERGLADGRQAGREDKTRRNAWDLEGQRELEQADAGYRSEFGSRAEYQAGYREGFMAGYREGFDLRF